MNIQFFWIGYQYDSIENCRITESGDSIIISSEIRADNKKHQFVVNYELEVDSLWRTKNFSLSLTQGQNITGYRLESLSNHQWKLNDNIYERLDNCIDIDLPLTPLTNSLPINRLKLNPGEEAVIDVVYLDIFGEGISARKQLYKRLEEYRYQYENLPNDFEAKITVDTEGFVLYYPELFSRVMR